MGMHGRGIDHAWQTRAARGPGLTHVTWARHARAHARCALRGACGAPASRSFECIRGRRKLRLLEQGQRPAGADDGCVRVRAAAALLAHGQARHFAGITERTAHARNERAHAHPSLAPKAPQGIPPPPPPPLRAHWWMQQRKMHLNRGWADDGAGQLRCPAAAVVAAAAEAAVRHCLQPSANQTKQTWCAAAAARAAAMLRVRGREGERCRGGGSHQRRACAQSKPHTPCPTGCGAG